MLIVLSVHGQDVDLAYHPDDVRVDVGDTFTILDLPNRTDGVVAQVIELAALEHDGVKGETIQRILEERMDETHIVYDRERGMGLLRGIKVAHAKVRREVRDGQWQPWTGYVPSRHAAVERVETEDLIRLVAPMPRVPLDPFLRVGHVPFPVGGHELDKITIVAAAKGRGKSHWMKVVTERFARKGVGCIVFDINGEYTGLPAAHVLRWGENFVPRLAQTGPGLLLSVIRSLCPPQPGSPTESLLESRLKTLFRANRDQGDVDLTITWLRGQSWGGAGDLVQRAIDSRLRQIEDAGLFWTSSAPRDAYTDLWVLHEETVKGRPLVFDLSLLESRMQATLVNALIRHIEAICERETRSGRGAYPVCVFEEAHEFLSASAVEKIVGRCRHLGLSQFYISLNPSGIPPFVLRACDNLILLGLTNAEDIRALARTTSLDAESLESLAVRVPAHHALLVGNLTGGYPVLAAVDDLPAGVPRSGVTRSVWDRFDA